MANPIFVRVKTTELKNMSGVSGVPPTGSSGDDQSKEVSSTPPSYKEKALDKAVGDASDDKTYNFMGMQCSKKEYDQMMAGIMKSMIDQVKQERSEYTQNAQQILQDEKEEDSS